MRMLKKGICITYLRILMVINLTKSFHHSLIECQMLVQDSSDWLSHEKSIETRLSNDRKLRQKRIKITKNMKIKMD